MSKYKEAFMLMTYRCAFGHEVQIWNSRDGVTPFTVKCRSCNVNQGMMRHIDLHKDIYAPKHMPKKGDWIFVDLTIEKAREYYSRYVEEWWDKQVDIPRLRDEFKSKEDAIQSLAQADVDSFAPHTPHLERV